MGLKKPAVGGKRMARGVGKPFQPEGSSSWVIEVRGLSFKPSIVASKPPTDYITANYEYRVGSVGVDKNVFVPPTKDDIQLLINNDGDYSVGKIVTFYDDGFKVHINKGYEQAWVAYE